MGKVSVIMPTYNRENTLLRAVNSVLQQTFPVHEILICDDGSTDNSRNIISSINDPKIKWIDCGRNGMPSIPRNKGIQAAGGEWIAFLDSDDEWLPKKIETQIKTLKAAAGLASSTEAYRIVNNANKGPIMTWKKNKITFSDLLAVNINICSSVLISKRLLEDVSMFPEEKEYKAIEDYALWLRIATRTSFCYVDEPLVNYYDDPTITVRTNYTNVWDLRKVVFSGLIQWIEKNRVKLEPAENSQLEEVYKEALAGGKTSLWKRIKKRIKN